MAFYRSRKTGNCSGSSKTNGCHRRLLKLRRSLFLFPDHLPYAPAGGVARTLERAWHRRGKLFFYGLWMRWPAGVARVAIRNVSAEWDRVPIGNRAMRGVPF